MKISKRLKECANHVAPYTKVADVGTDHALLPIYLVQNNIATHVFASDVREGPLGFAKRNIQKEGFDNIEIILSDGIKHINESVEVIIVSGMGGKLISEIISDNLYNVQRLILQPNMASNILRKKLQEIGFSIIDEIIITDNDIFYEIIVADRGVMNLSEDEIIFGPVLLEERSENFLNYWNEELLKLSKIIKKVPKEHENHSKLDELIGKIQEVLWN